MNDFSHALKGMLLAAFGFSLFSMGDVFSKYIADEGYTPVQIGFWASTFALIGFLSIAPEVGGLKKAFQSKHKKLHFVRGLLGMCVFFFVINGFVKLGMAMTYTLLFAGPFIAALLSVVILKERFGVHRWVSIAVGFIGVLVVLRPGSSPVDIAALGMLLAAFFHASSSIIIRKIGNNDPIIAFAIFNAMTSFVFFGIINYVQGGFDKLPDIPHLTFFASVMFFHIGGTFAVTRAFNQTETALVAPVHYIQLLWGILFGYVLFDTAIDLWTGVGAAIIVLSGIYMIWREKVKNAELNRGTTALGGMD